MTTNETNPYVGPRPFERKKEDTARFFGRSHETQEIVSLILGHPVTLVYAQSGAGKTSLFNASVAVELEESGFDVLPLTRVGGVIPKDIALDKVRNLYMFNALLQMDPESDPRTLLTKSLLEFLEMRPRTTDENGQQLPRAVIFDQFEELFTYTPEDWREQRKGFFHQVVEALNADKLLRVVFVIREDYLAELDPYVRDLPERLRIRYRLERLREDAALRAIKQPLEKTDRHFAPEVAEKLIEGLLATRVVDATGNATTIKGQYVEPVQLQVVCVTLWDSLAPDVTEIHEEHLKDFDVNSALSDFYTSAIDGAVKETGVKETDLRNLFGRTLITPMETRSTIFRGKESTSGVSNAAMDYLESRHIIRAEFRAGVRWYELTHDRFIEAILANNKDWFAKRRKILGNPLTEPAQEWKRLGKDKGSLPRGAALNEMDSWAEAHKNELDDLENEFLQASWALYDEELAAKTRSEKRLRSLVIGLGVALVFALVAIFAAFNQADKARHLADEATKQKELAVKNEADANAAKAKAENEASAALSGQLAAFALNKLSSQPDLAILLGLEADRLNTEADRLNTNVNTQNTLLTLQQETASVKGYLKLETLPDEFQFSPDGKIIASRDKTGIKLWDANTFQPLNNDLLIGHYSGVTAWTLSPKGEQMASGGADGTVVIWDINSGEKVIEPFKSFNNPISNIAFSNDGKTLAVSSWGDVSILLWDISKTAKPQQIGALYGHTSSITSLAISPDSKTLASASYDGTAILWDLVSQKSIGDPLSGHQGAVFGIAFTPDSKTLAAGSYDDTVILWNITDLSKPRQIGKALTGPGSDIETIAISPDGNTLASGDDFGDIFLWDIHDPSNVTSTEQPLNGNTSWVVSLGFSPDSKTLVSGSLDGKVSLWDLENNSQIGDTFMAHNNSPVRGVGLTSNEKILFTAGEDSFIRSWGLAEDIKNPRQTGKPLQGHLGFPTGIRFSTDGSLLASIGYEGTIFFNVSSAEKLGYGDFIDTRANDDLLAYKITSNNETNETNVYIKEIFSGTEVKIPIPGTNPILSANGKILVYRTTNTGSELSQLHIWDVSAKKELSGLISGESPILSADGKLLIYSTNDRETNETSLNVWDVEKSEPIIEGISGTYLGISDDNRILAYSSFDPQTGMTLIDRWDLTEDLPVDEGISTDYYNISDNGGSLALSFYDQEAETSKIKILNLFTGEFLESIDTEGNFLAFSPDGQLLFYQSNSSEGTPEINIINATTGKIIGESINEAKLWYSNIDGKPRIVQQESSLAFEFNKQDKIQIAVVDLLNETISQIGEGSYKAMTKDGKILVFEKENEIHLWDTGKNSPIGQTLRGVYLGISPDGKTLAFHNGSGLITFKDLSKSWQLGIPIQDELVNVSRATISQNGSTLAWISEDGIFVQEPINNKLFSGPYKDNSSNIVPGSWPAFSPDGRLLAVSNFDTYATTLWDMDGRGTVEYVLQNSFSYPAFSPDGRLLAIGNFNTGTATIWDTNSHKPVGNILQDSFAYPSFSPDGKLLAIANNSTVALWNVNTHEQSGDMFPGAVSAFSPDGKLLAIGSYDTYTTTIWDVNSRIPVGDPLPGSIPIFSPDGKLLAIGSSDTYTTTIWDVNSRIPVGDPLPGFIPAFSPDGKLLAIGSYDTYTTTVWNMKSHEPIEKELPGNYPTFSPDGNFLAIGNDTTVTTAVWKLDTNENLFHPFNYFLTSPENVVLSSDARHFASYALGDIAIRNLDADKSIHLETGEYTGQINSQMSFYADDTRFAAIGNDGTLLSWDITEENTADPVEDQPPQIKSAAFSTFSPTGYYLAYVYGETNLSIWDVKNGEMYASLKNPEIGNAIGSIAFSADEEWLAYSDGPKIVLWNVKDMSTSGIAPLLTDLDSISVLSIIMEGNKIKYIVTVDESNSTQIWDLEKRTKLGNPMQNIKIVGVNSNEHLVYYLDQTSRLIQWQWDSDLYELFCPRVNRNLTLNEWNTYLDNPNYESTCSADLLEK